MWLIKQLRLIEEYLLQFIFFLFPVSKNKIVFINFGGRGFGCNPKYIAQELLDNNCGYDLVWFVNDMNELFPKGIRLVPFYKAIARYEIATAKVIVTNEKCNLHLIKKKSQYVIQTWHGSYSSKRLEAEAADTLSASYLAQSRKNSAQTNLFLSNSRVLSDCYRSAFWCNCEIMECGFPRNDILFAENRLSKAKIKADLGLSDQAKLVLYAPTFRDNGDTSAYSIDCAALINMLKQKDENWKILIRMHPNVTRAAEIFEFNEDIINATAYPDMQELLFAADILITDYSSSVFEFAAMGKATYIYACDVEEYQKMRGLKSDFFDMPYKICTTNKELIDEISNYTPEIAKQNAERFMELFGGVDNGTASKQVAERINQVINGTFKF